MSRYVVPPPPRVQSVANLDSSRITLLRWLLPFAAMGTLLVWWSDERNGMNSAWASASVPMMSAVLAACSVMVWVRPMWHNLASGLSAFATALYFVGSLVAASHSANANSLYQVASNAQFMPILYLGAFVTMARGAALLSWLTFSTVAMAYVTLFGLPPPRTQDQLSHFWFTLLITHPLTILALSYINVLHKRLSAAEADARSGRERFLAMLSHEIRTPLQSMLGSIDLLDLKVRGELERRALDRLRQVSVQLEAHLRDVTEYTRLDNPSWRLHLQAVDMPRLLRDSTEALQPRALSLNLVLQCDVEDDSRLRQVQTDPTRVRQILDNLLHNALKYTSKGGITVRLTVQSPAGQPEAQAGQHPWMLRDALALSVHDTGVGIAPDAMAQIFEPYVRLEDQRLPRTEGSGLGLAVVRRLVDRLGGQIEVESSPQEGTRFTVLLPLNEAALAPQ